MQLLGYYSIYLLQDLLDAGCALLLIALLYQERFHLWTKSRAPLVALFSFLSLFSAWTVANLTGEPIYMLLIFPLVYMKVPAFFIYLCKRNRASILMSLVVYEVVIDILAQTTIYLTQSGAQGLGYVRQARFDIVNCAWRLILFCLLFLVEKRVIGKNLGKNIVPPQKRILLLVLFSLLCIAMMESNIFSQEDFPELARFLSVILVALMMVLVSSLLLINRNNQLAKKIVGLLTKQVETQIDHYKELSSFDNELRSFRHDYKNMLLCLRILIEANETEQALEYIENVHAMAPEREQAFDSGNYIADALLNAKNKDAAKHNARITFDGFIPTMNINTVDLCVILSNALDNAIEACSKIGGEKSISIESKIENRFWFINIQNPSPSQVLVIGNSIKTSKDDKELHGYGLNNIERVIQRCGGKLNLSCANGVFVFDAALKLDYSGS